MAESGPQRQVLAARERTGGRGVVVVALVTAAYVAGWRSGRRWGRLVGW
jgi:hypothetical protein